MSRTKKLTQEQKDWRRAQRKAAKENAKVAAALPLFQESLPKAQPEDAYWRWRRMKAGAGENQWTMHHPGDKGCEALDNIQANRLREMAKNFVTLETLAKLDAKRWQTYPNNAEWSISFWVGVLTGKQIVLSLKKIPAPDNKVFGFRVEDDEVFKLEPPPYSYQYLSDTHLSGRWQGMAAALTPEDGGLAELLEGVIARNRKEQHSEH